MDWNGGWKNIMQRLHYHGKYNENQMIKLLSALNELREYKKQKQNSDTVEMNIWFILIIWVGKNI